MNKILNWFIKSVLAGLFIGIGCLAYLSSADKIIGALLFTVGLFVILTFKLNLFTGKICYIIEKKNYLEVVITLIGNFIGTLLLALICRATRLINLIDYANAICEINLSDSYISLFILGILCNILIYVAVEGYNKFKDIRGILSVFFGVVIFIVIGFEHCIADMFYFNFTFAYSCDVLLRLLFVVLGNCIGGISIRYLFRRCNEIFKGRY